MDESDQTVVRSRAWSFVDQAHPCLLQPLQRFFQIVDLQANVMQSLSALRDELADRRVFLHRFQQFQTCFSKRNYRYAGFLVRNLFDMDRLQRQSRAVEFQCSLQRSYGYANVINLAIQGPNSPLVRLYETWNLSAVLRQRNTDPFAAPKPAAR